ncbi:MAG: DUF362 domain-containing protein [Eubacteriales bacterium]|nr:DUF362 domain-containing protein [Eubacteriales bacterium]
MSVVSIRRSAGYEEEALYEAVCAHFEALEVEKELTPETKVLLKVNLLAAREPESAATTHPALVRAVARRVKELGVKQIVLADSPGGMYTAAILRKTYTVCGMDGLSDLAALNMDVSAADRNGFTLIRPVLDADYIIDCAKLKTHGLTTMTGCVKNLFGCIPGLKKPEIHCVKPTIDSFAHYLIALCEEVKPKLCLLDAVECMEGNGPGGGSVRFMGYTLCSRSPYGIDEQAALLMGLPANMPPINRLARQMGMLCGKTELVGDELIPAEPPFILPDAILQKERFFTPNGIFHCFLGQRRTLPHVVEENCVGCGRCAESCPRHLIRVENHKAVMESKGCISCFCCQEMCPAHAIDVRRKRFFQR